MRHEDTQVTSSYDWLTDLRDQNPCGDSWYRTDDGDIVNGCLTCGERADCAMKATEDRLTAFIGRLENEVALLRKMLFHDDGTPIAETPQGVCLIPPESLRMLLAVTSAAERRWFEESRISMPGEPFPSEEWMEADKELTEALGPFTRGDADAED